MKRPGFIIAVAALAATAMSFSTQNSAQAYCRGCAVGAGVITGIAAGAIIGSAIANSTAQALPPAPVYAAPPPPPDVADPNDAMNSAVCHEERQRIWVDGVGYRWSTTEVCD